MKITIIDYTENPLQMIGKCAGECYNSDVNDATKNFKRGKSVIEDKHYRNLELARVTFKVEGISARMARELYTHIAGSPTRLQASTRYINYEGFDFVNPIDEKELGHYVYKKCMESIEDCYNQLKEVGYDNDVLGYMLPLGMTTTVVWSGNMRTLVSMAEQRLCNLSLKEFRDFMKLLKTELSLLDEEWEYLSELMKPKCEIYGTCFEKRSCKKRGVK